MIRRTVTPNREARIQLLVAGPTGQEREIEAIIDTGFTGFLTLPRALVASLGLSWVCRQPGILADGHVDFFDVYAVTVIWDDQSRLLEVAAVDSDPWVGMSLMDRHSLHLDVVNGGAVIITALP